MRLTTVRLYDHFTTTFFVLFLYVKKIVFLFFVCKIYVVRLTTDWSEPIAVVSRRLTVDVNDRV